MFLSDGVSVINNYYENKLFVYLKDTHTKYEINDDLFFLLEYINNNSQLSVSDLLAEFDGIDDIISFLFDAKIISNLRPKCKYQIKKVGDINSARVFIECTDKCNLSCPHCYGAFGKRNNTFLGISQIRKLLEECQKIGVYEVDITGGEPFMHPNINEILDLLYEYSMLTTLFSNLTICDDNHLNKIITTGVKTVVTSIESFDSEIHNSFRGLNNALSKTIRNIKYLKDHGVEVKVNLVLGNHNIESAEKTIDFILSLSVPCNIDVTTLEGRAKDLSFDINKAISVLKKYNNGEISNNCGFANRMIFISCDGDIYPCPSVRNNEFLFGNINSDYDLYSSFSEVLDLLKGWNCNSICNNPKCPGGCRARSLSMNGTLKSHDPYYCLIYREG